MSNMLCLFLHVHYDRMLIRFKFNAMFLPSPKQCELGQIWKCKPTARIAIQFSSGSIDTWRKDSKDSRVWRLCAISCRVRVMVLEMLANWKVSPLRQWSLQNPKPGNKEERDKFPSMFPTFLEITCDLLLLNFVKKQNPNMWEITTEMLKIEALIWISFWRALKFQHCNWRAYLNLGRHWKIFKEILFVSWSLNWHGCRWGWLTWRRSVGWKYANRDGRAPQILRL